MLEARAVQEAQAATQSPPAPAAAYEGSRARLLRRIRSKRNADVANTRACSRAMS